MGTRHLICLYHNGRIVVAQYGGHDGHPSHTGRQIMSLLSSAHFIQRLRANLHLIRYRPSRTYGDYADDDIGICILENIAYARGSEPVPHSFGLEFADDGAFCEWTYVVDLDAEVLEVYAGASISGLRVEGRGRLAEVGIRRQVLRVAIPFIDLPGEKEELVRACTKGLEVEGEEGW